MKKIKQIWRKIPVVVKRFALALIIFAIIVTLIQHGTPPVQFNN